MPFKRKAKKAEPKKVVKKKKFIDQPAKARNRGM
jgi:hypothetical protein